MTPGGSTDKLEMGMGGGDNAPPTPTPSAGSTPTGTPIVKPQRKYSTRTPAVYIGSTDFILEEEVERGPTEKLRAVVPWVKQRVRRACTRKMLYRRLPILDWLPRYNRSDFLGDLVAGITVGLTVIPQSLAYSNVAGLPAQYGLYGSFLGCLLYIFLGSCKDVPMGPTAITALLVYQSVHGAGPEYAVLLCFLTGVVQLLMGILGLGFIIDFVSGPVSSGFTSAVAIIIVSTQVKDILGIKASGSTFVSIWTSVFEDIQNTRLWDPILGIICIVVLLLMRMVANVELGPSDSEKQSRVQRIINSSLWLIGTSRNAILVVVTGVLGYHFAKDGAEAPFKVIGNIPPGLPTFQAPPFSVVRGNDTLGFVDMVTELGSGIIVLPLVALLENIAICKAFANGKTVDATQEMLALGACNIACSLVQAFPGSGSLSRSAVNNSSGVRTPLGGLYTGLLVILALLFFTPYFAYIPKTALAAVIIAAVVFMVEVRVVAPIWRSKKSDLIPGAVTFVACLVLALEVGIVIGIGTNLVFILYHAARPKISMIILKSQGGVDYMLLTPDRCLIFPSVDYVRNIVTKYSIKQNNPVVIDCSHIYGADFTAAKVIESLTQDFSRRGQTLFFYNLKPSVVAVFEGLQPQDFHVYYNEAELDELLKKYQKPTPPPSSISIQL
ncbi:sodium-independent sulfate anion transporter [Frankliniella occidentalis]|uniref:Sodium-independent sulfate anion transporter n=1 Tax=Frankliniella occidentalis TaxID=133901 RepID=A0A6J1RYA8_FRAOC|nr:sodium-independent sulfate anion transporter [Frankliniella occidentalis]